VKMHLLDFCESYIEAAKKTAKHLNIESFVNFYCGNALLLTEMWIKDMRINVISTTAAVDNCFDLKMLQLASVSEDIKLFLFSSSRKGSFRKFIQSKSNTDGIVVVDYYAKCNIATDQEVGESRSFLCIDFDQCLNKENRSIIHQKASKEFRHQLYDSIRRSIYTDTGLHGWLDKRSTRNMFQAILDENILAEDCKVNNPLHFYDEFISGFTLTSEIILLLREKVKSDLEPLSKAGKESYRKVLPPVIQLLKCKLFEYLNEKQLTFLQPGKNV
jgi:hypothetical protein